MHRIIGKARPEGSVQLDFSVPEELTAAGPARPPPGGVTNGDRADFAVVFAVTDAEKRAHGAITACLDQATGHVRTRMAFGKPLAAFQDVSFPLAESRVEIEAMRWLTYRSAWAVDEAARSGDDVPMLESSIVKYFNTDRAYQIADRCPQVFGGQGVLKEGWIESTLRHLRMLRVVEGASEVQKRSSLALWAWKRLRTLRITCDTLRPWLK